MLTFFSCGKPIYGTYSSNHSKDKSAFFQIKLNSDNTVEKTEIHTIGNFAKGRYIIEKNQITCFLDSSRNMYPRDTLKFVLKGTRLYSVVNGVVNKKFYLKKQ